MSHFQRLGKVGLERHWKDDCKKGKLGWKATFRNVILQAVNSFCLVKGWKKSDRSKSVKIAVYIYKTFGILLMLEGAFLEMYGKSLQHRNYLDFRKLYFYTE